MIDKSFGSSAMKRSEASLFCCEFEGSGLMGRRECKEDLITGAARGSGEDVESRAVQ